MPRTAMLGHSPATPPPASSAVQPSNARRSKRAHATMLIGLLNDCLANEICCVLLYSRRQFIADRHISIGCTNQFLQNLSDEQSHADRIAVRIVELGGELECQDKILDSIQSSALHSLQTEAELIRATLAAEKWSIETYLLVLSHIGDTDPVTWKLVDGILATETRDAFTLPELLPLYSASGTADGPHSTAPVINAAD